MSLIRVSRSVPEPWMILAYSTCFSDRLRVRVLGQLLRQDQQAVERRAQLVRHVGEELGLVLRRQGELGGLVFEREPRLLDLAVLVLHLHVLLGEQAGFLRQLFVGVLQLLLAALQLGGERLRLLEQALGAAVRLDVVQHHADALHELVEERQVGRAELVEGRQLDHRLDLLLEQDRQHHRIARQRLAQAGGDPIVLARHAAHDDALLLERALADQSLAGPELRGQCSCVRDSRRRPPA